MGTTIVARVAKSEPVVETSWNIAVKRFDLVVKMLALMVAIVALGPLG